MIHDLETSLSKEDRPFQSGVIGGTQRNTLGPRRAQGSPDPTQIFREGFLEEMVSPGDGGESKGAPDAKQRVCQAEGSLEQRPGEEKALGTGQ